MQQIQKICIWCISPSKNSEKYIRIGVLSDDQGQ